MFRLCFLQDQAHVLHILMMNPKQQKSQPRILFPKPHCKVLFCPWPDSRCWGLVEEKMGKFLLFSRKKFLLCFRLDGTCWGLAFLRNQTFWIGKHSITFCELGYELRYSSIDYWDVELSTTYSTIIVPKLGHSIPISIPWQHACFQETV